MWQPAGIRFDDIASEVVVGMRPQMQGVTVGIDLTNWGRPGKSVQVIRIGGTAQGLFDEALLQIDARAETYDDCYDIMQAVREFMGALPLDIPKVVSVRERGGLGWMPELDGGQPRMTCDFLVRFTGTQTRP